jgi:hypothetical protein
MPVQLFATNIAVIDNLNLCENLLNNLARGSASNGVKGLNQKDRPLTRFYAPLHLAPRHGKLTTLIMLRARDGNFIGLGSG